MRTSPLPLIKVSLTVTLLSVTLPVFSETIVYTATSPRPVLASPLSVTLTVLVISIEGVLTILFIVGSFSVFPSVSSPSSEISLTSLVFPGLEAVAVTVFETPPASTAACSIM